jgi:putative DNA primase/helicase
MTFVPSKPDVGLSDVLQAEQRGILAWAIRGCLAWQRDGLTEPDAVAQAGSDYFAEQDSLGAWVDERCMRGPANSPPEAGSIRHLRPIEFATRGR